MKEAKAYAAIPAYSLPSTAARPPSRNCLRISTARCRISCSIAPRGSWMIPLGGRCSSRPPASVRPTRLGIGTSRALPRALWAGRTPHGHCPIHNLGQVATPCTTRGQLPSYWVVPLCEQGYAEVRFRGELSGEVVLTLARDRCLQGHCHGQIETEDIRNAPLQDADRTALQRHGASHG